MSAYGQKEANTLGMMWPNRTQPLHLQLEQFDFYNATPPKQPWRRKLNSHANLLKEFSMTFRKAIKMKWQHLKRFLRRSSGNGKSFWVYVMVVLSWPINSLLERNHSTRVSGGCQEANFYRRIIGSN